MTPAALARRVAAVCVVAAAACDGAAPAVPAALSSVPVPALEQATPSVRAQITSAFAQHLPLAEDPAASADARAVAYGTLGRLLLAASLYASAEPALANARALAPEDPAWPHYLAHLHRQRGEADDAASLFEAVIALAPGDVAAHVWLGRMRLAVGDPAAARAAFEAARALAPDDLSARAGLGRAALALDDPASAVRELEAVLGAAPDATSLHYPLGQAYRGLGDASRAEEHLIRSGEGGLTPPDPRMDALATLLDSPLSHQRRGLDAMDRGAWREAAAAFRSALAVVPEDDVVLQSSLTHRLGSSLWLDGQAAAAVAQFEAGVALDPTYALNHYSLGVIAATRGDAAAALARFEAGVAADPDYVEARVALGNVLHGLGRPAEALPHYEHAMVVAPDAADARYGRALALVDLGEVEQARALLTQGIDRHPDDERFRDALGALLGF